MRRQGHWASCFVCFFLSFSLTRDPNFVINMLVMGEYRLSLLGDLPKIKKKNKTIWHFEICCYIGPNGSGNFKMLLLLQFSSDAKISKGYCCHSLNRISIKFYGKGGNQGIIQAVILGTFKISYLSYIASIHKTKLVSSGKMSRRSSRPLGLLLYR